MKFTLVDYQEKAVTDALGKLTKARQMLTADIMPVRETSFALTAATGAGKTVIAAALIESLFFGNETNNFDADENAVVLWFSQDPILNHQTRGRLLEASDLLSYPRTEIIEPTFTAEKFKAGHVYFINTAKFASHSTLVRGHDPDSDASDALMPRPDGRRYTIWDTIRNTINDEDLNLYLFLDEAHQGMGGERDRAGNRQKGTIIQRLINGHADVPPVPIVFGISATPERFQEAIGAATSRIPLGDVEVDREAVMESGLVKENVILTGLDGEGKYDTILLRDGVKRLRELSLGWDVYTSKQREPRVVPLMVVQVPNTPSDADLARWADIILEEWDDLAPSNLAHVFGDHSPLEVGGMSIPHVNAELVNENTWIRVLFAKDAISTGWDCPRAEVMVSFRASNDPTTITQLLGRLVRAPLRRRIPGHGVLNSVYCALPKFNQKAVSKVIDLLTTVNGKGDPLPVPRVLTHAAPLMPNPNLKEKFGSEVLQSVLDTLADLPTENAPRPGLRPIPRFMRLGIEANSDKLAESADKLAIAQLNHELDALGLRYQDKVGEQIESVEQAQLLEHTVRYVDGEDAKPTTETLIIPIDKKTLDDAFSYASRQFSTPAAQNYVKHLVSKYPKDEQPDHLREARIRVAAMGRVPELVEDLDKAAIRFATEWFDRYMPEIRGLVDARREAYDNILTHSTEVTTTLIGTIQSDVVPTKVEVGDKIEDIPTYSSHVLSLENGQYPWLNANKAEKHVLDTEAHRKGFLGWYRNPSSGKAGALRIAYERDDRYRHMHPDFVFFFDRGGKVAPAIIDPHGSQLSDSLPKLVGLANFAEAHQDTFMRIESVADISGGTYRSLDLLNPAVRQAIREAEDPVALFNSDHARPYGSS